MLVENINNGFSPEFNTFVKMYNDGETIISKAKTMLAVDAKKLSEIEVDFFKKIVNYFTKTNTDSLDTKTLILMLEKFSDETIDYTMTPLPLSEIEVLNENYISFE